MSGFGVLEKRGRTGGSVTGSKRRTGIAPILTVFAAGALLAGCSNPDSAADPPAGAGPTRAGTNASDVSRVGWPAAVPASGLTQGLVLPLEAYEETYPQQVAIDRGVYALESKCMGTFGFTLPDPGFGNSPPVNNDASNMARRYGIADLAQAREYGYGLPEAGNGNGGDAPAVAPALPGIENYIMTGGQSPGASGASASPGATSYHNLAIPAGGCAGQARRTLNVSEDVTALPDQLDAASLNESQANPQVQAVISQWSSCMAGDGYTVADPYAAADLAQSEPTQGTAIAVADVTCKQKTNLVHVWYEVETGIQQQDVEHNQLALTQALSSLQAEVKAATLAAG